MIVTIKVFETNGKPLETVAFHGSDAAHKAVMHLEQKYIGINGTAGMERALYLLKKYW